MPARNSEPVRSLPPRTKAFAYLCLVPVFGLVPALLALVSQRSRPELKDTARTAFFVGLVWLMTYTAAGATQGDEGFRVSVELFKATLTSGYFISSIWLMSRLFQEKSMRLPWFGRKKEKESKRSIGRLTGK